MLRLALVTDAEHPDLGGELDLLEPALRAAGIDASAQAWDDPSVDWAGFAGAAIRSTWDYIGRVDEFRRWLTATERSTPVANPPGVVTWNTDKRYLRVLARAGVPVVDTVFIPPGSDEPLPTWPDLVVKPAVSSGARRTGRFGPERGPEAHRLVAAIHDEGNVAMVQPYLRSVDVEGETDVVVFGREPSHAVAKGAILSIDRPAAEDQSLALLQTVEATLLDSELRTFAAVAVAAVPGRPDLLYARVDSAIALDGTRRLMELELVEPYLFLTLAPDPEGAAAAFATATRRWLTG